MSSDLLIVYDNTVDRAIVTASSTVGTTAVASNLKNDIKGKIHRGYAGSVTYNLTWPVNQTIGAVAIPTTNVSANTVLTVQLYSDDAWSTQTYIGSSTALPILI